MGIRRGIVFTTIAAATACSLVYSTYDDRFHAPLGPSDSGLLVVDESGVAAISALTVNEQGVFYGMGSSIKLVALDGGGVSIWWSGDASSISALATDGTTMVAWAVGAAARYADATPSNAVMLDDTVGLSGNVIVGDSNHFAASVPAQHPCPPCSTAHVLGWNGSGAQALVWDGDAHASFGIDNIAIGSLGVSVMLSPGGLVRFGFDGGLACTPTGSITNLSTDQLPGGLAVSPSDAYVFIIDINHGLTRYQTDGTSCVTPTSGSTPLVTGGVGAVATDSSNVYWVTQAGTLFTMPFAADAGVAMGSTLASSNYLIAVDDAAVYVAVAASIYAFQK
jgi:hypothetical protein